MEPQDDGPPPGTPPGAAPTVIPGAAPGQAPGTAPEAPRTIGTAELGLLAHVYRGEVYRSTVWRTRLDTTTNWSVVTLGVALSITFASPDASALPLILVGILIILFLALEARRYRYFNLWRARSRWMERHLIVPTLHEGRTPADLDWRLVLAEDYLHPRYHVSYLTALSRRIRSNYFWILLVQALAYLGKLLVHPTAATSVEDVVDRATIGPVPGLAVLAVGALYVALWGGLGLRIALLDARAARGRRNSAPMG